MNMIKTAATSKGKVDGTVSAQWASRPDDQRFLTLDDLRAQVHTWAMESHAETFDPRTLILEADPADPFSLQIALGDGRQIEPTFNSFGQLCSTAGAPAKYLRRLPAALAAVNLTYGLRAEAPAEVSGYIRENGSRTLRALTSPSYGRIFDFEVVDQVRDVVEASGGRWKIPGTIAWGSRAGEGQVWYDPNTPVTMQSTTLYASDHDVFCFMVDDLNPIEIGTLPDGSPDLVFRGFMVSNSETGNRTFTLRTMLLRGVCQNRNLWGVEDVNEITIRHTSGAPDRFVAEGGPALLAYAEAAQAPFLAKITAARAIEFAGDDAEDRQIALLTERLGFTQKVAKAILATDPNGGGAAERLPENLWELTQAATAYARQIPFSDDRVEFEARIGKVMEKV